MNTSKQYFFVTIHDGIVPWLIVTHEGL